ncbi:dehydrodolichyl diphosphate synthase 6-like [Asparagus officinalis]|uniref:dehydrodolichyl diphosphate synthase 6-like n=1 Tax=Asparagus officinalis TaxID=4686 RepID=UPI00098E09E8|nr:dehydrodolichyl diphosphate synthase 6-like [Asparagus officinalis]XP_020251468.1 dehydrodolichyl diphosphate synthase 6-like [Asparagus officinalis]
MEKKSSIKSSTLLGRIWGFFQKCLFLVLSFGPMPNHIAFIMDGNRRFAKSRGIKQGGGHSIGFAALISTLQYCYEMGVKYVTVYAFSIDNFKRKPEEVQSVMKLMQEKIDELLKEESIVNEYGIRINFWGNLKLLSDPVRLAVEKAMTTTAKNTGPVLSVCVAYTSTDEIMHAIEESCTKKINKVQERNGSGYEIMENLVSVADLEQLLYTADCPDPDIVIRTSGETRLSNFLLWQTTFSHLQNPSPLWPEFSFRHLVWAILEYQKVYPYLKELRSKNKKQN